MDARVGVVLLFACGACGRSELPIDGAHVPTTPDLARPYRSLDPAARWWKGNSLARSLWSDGDLSPEAVACWHRRAGYDFVAFAERNTVPAGERWVPDAQPGSTRSLREAECVRWLGEDWTEHSKRDGELRLMTIAELRSCFERPESFAIVDAQRVAHDSGLHEVELLVLGAHGRLELPCGPNRIACTELQLASALAQGAEPLGTPVVTCVAGTDPYSAADLAALRCARFLELAHGRNDGLAGGDDARIAAETLWDEANALRAAAELPLLFGLVGDDGPLPVDEGLPDDRGRPWIGVRAPAVDSEALLIGMADGDFYLSTGVGLQNVEFDGRTLTVDIDVERRLDLPACTLPTSPLPPGPLDWSAFEYDARYVTHFVGARRGGSSVELLAETSEDPARYTLAGDELFVRAEVSEDVGPRDNLPARAWTQPVRPAR